MNGHSFEISRIGCSTLMFRELSLEDALDVIVSLGFDRIDLVMVPPRFCPHFNPITMSSSSKENLIKLIKENKIKVSSFNVFPGFLDQDNNDYQIAFIGESVTLARELGASIVTVPGGSQAMGDQWNVRAAKTVENLRKVADVAEKKGIILSLESPHLGTLTVDKESTFQFLELLNDERIGLTFDTSHVLACGWNSLVDAWRDLGKRVNHVHLRDCRGKNILVTPGKGTGDFKELFKCISMDGYKGDLNIELEYAPFVPYRKFRSLIYRLHRYAFKHRLLRYRFKISPPQIPNYVKAVEKEIGYTMKYFSNILGKDSGYVNTSIKSASQSGKKIKYKKDAGKIKVAILGCGWAGRIAHGQAIKKLNKANIVGVCDINRDIADATSKELSCPAYYNLNEMIKRSGAHIVFNCTREWDHFSTTTQLFDAGIDVFCEKILCARYEDANTLICNAKKRGRILGVNYNYHQLPAVQIAEKVIKDGRFGEISNIDILCHAYCFHHALDIALYLGGRVESVYASYEDRPELRQLPGWEKYINEMLYIPTISCKVVLNHSNGVRSCISSSILFSDRQFLMSLNIIFGRARLSVPMITYEDIIGQPFFPESEDILCEMMAVDYEGGLQRTFDLMIDDFLSRYVEKQEIEIDGEYALDVMKLERAIVKSNTSKTEINL